MPKLDTTIDNIELKSNKVISTSDPSAWTDAQYPSAKALLDIAHPVGSIITTTTNENPASKVGGDWDLIDKAFKGTFMLMKAADWTATNATLHETSNVLLIDHTINLRIYVNLTKDATEADLLLGKLDLTSYGVTSLSSAVYRQPAISESGNCTACYTLSTDGSIILNDVLNINGTHAAAISSDFIFNIVFPVGYDRMKDEFCDKFYWKRIA